MFLVLEKFQNNFPMCTKDGNLIARLVIASSVPCIDSFKPLEIVTATISFATDNFFLVKIWEVNFVFSLFWAFWSV